jgi:hypothetical protein
MPTTATPTTATPTTAMPSTATLTTAMPTTTMPTTTTPTTAMPTTTSVDPIVLSKANFAYVGSSNVSFVEQVTDPQSGTLFTLTYGLTLDPIVMTVNGYSLVLIHDSGGILQGLSLVNRRLSWQPGSSASNEMTRRDQLIPDCSTCGAVTGIVCGTGTTAACAAIGYLVT